MTSKKSLKELKDKMTNIDGRLCLFDKLRFESIEKDLEILELFKELFDGEELDGWIEFNFGLTREDEDSIDNYNGWVTKLKKIRSWLEKQRRENEK